MSQNEDRRSQSAAEQALINAPLPFEDTFVSSPDEDDLREKLDKWMSNQAFEINSPDMRNILTLLARLASQSSAGEIAVHTFFVPLLVWLWSGLWETDVLMSQGKKPKLGTHEIDSSQRYLERTVFSLVQMTKNLTSSLRRVNQVRRCSCASSNQASSL